MRFRKLILERSHSLPWQLGTGQQGWSTNGALRKAVYKTYCMRHFVTQYYLSLTCSGSRPTPNPLPSRPLFVAGNLPPPPPSSSSFSVRHTFCLALRRRRVSRVLIGRFALGKLWRQFPWSTPTHLGAAEVARKPRNAGARLRGRTTCAL